MPASSKFRPVLVSALLAAAFAAPAYAQYVTQSARDKSPDNVGSILANPVDDQQVLLRGNLLRKVGDEKYVFSDGSGEIIVEIDDDDFNGEQVDEKTKVELRGEVDTGLRRPPDIDVDSLRVVR